MFCGLSLTQNQKEVHKFYLVREVWKICSCGEKGNFIVNGEFKYGQTRNIWAFPLSWSLCSRFYCQNQLNLTKVFLSVLPYTEKPQIREMLFVILSLFLSNMNVIANTISPQKTLGVMQKVSNKILNITSLLFSFFK